MAVLPDPLSGWAGRAAAAVRADGAGGVVEAARTFPNACATAALQAAGPVGQYGDPTNVFEREWDVLVVLDACRHDAMERVADGDRFERRDRIVSVASQSAGWLARTFDHPRAREETVGYVTANPHTEAAALEPVDELDEVWRDAWDGTAGTVRPRAVTDRAIAAGRAWSVDRLIVHYMQPHAPYLPSPVGETTDLDTWGEGLPRSDPFYRLRAGDVDVARVRSAYRENLAAVLAEVDLLVENVAGDRAVVTADHGESFGEYGVYGHPPRVRTPVLRVVPWCVTTPTDTGEHDPESHARDTDETVADRLASLGYV